MHRQTLGEPARHVESVSVRENTWLISCHRVEAQWKLPAGAGRAVHGNEGAVGGGGESDSQRAQAGQAEGANGEVLMVGVNFSPRTACELDLVLLLVSRDDALHSPISKYGRSSSLPFLSEPEDDEAGLDGVELLVAIE